MQKRNFLITILTTLSLWLTVVSYQAMASGTWQQVFDTTSITSNVYNLRKVIEHNDRFLAVGYIAPSTNGTHSSGNGTPLIMSSDDGLSWSNISPNLDLNYGYLYDIKYINNHYVAVGTYNTQATGFNARVLILTSTDGNQWNQITTIGGFGELGGTAYTVGYGNGIYTLGESSNLYYSSDLQNWSKATYDYSAYSWSHTTYANGTFVVTGSAVTSEYRLISTDGITWSNNRESGTPGGNHDIQYLNHAFYNTAYSHGIASSSDTSSWQDITPALFSPTALGIDYADNTFVIGGGSPGQTGNYNGHISVTTDFQTWWSEKLNEYIEGGLISIAHNNDGFVAITYKGNIYYSAFSSRDHAPSLSSASSINLALDENLEYTITIRNMSANRYQLYRLEENSNNQIDYSNTGLPNGLSFDTSTGIISGAASETGAFRFAIRAYQSSPEVGDREFGTILSINITETGSDGTGNGDNNNSDGSENTDGSNSENNSTDSSNGNSSDSSAAISDWVVRNDISYQSEATWIKDDSEGQRLNGGVWTNGRPNSDGESDGNGIQSSQNYNFLGTTSYAKFKLNGGGQYAAWFIRPWYLPASYLNTHHSFANGLLVEEDTWLYATYEVNEDSTWTVSISVDNYSNQGGHILHTESGTLTDEQKDKLKSSPFLVSFTDNYGGTDAYMILAEVKIASDSQSAETCPDATLSSDLKMHFPYLSYQPLFQEKIYLSTNAVYAPEKTGALYFKVTDYTLISSDELPDSSCEPATLSSNLQLSLPSLKYTLLDGSVFDLSVEFQLESEADGTLYLRVVSYSGL